MPVLRTRGNRPNFARGLERARTSLDCSLVLIAALSQVHSRALGRTCPASAMSRATATTARIRGRLFGRADLYDRAARLVIEFDGSNHRDRLVEDVVCRQAVR